MKKVGILFGMEDTFPWAFIDMPISTVGDYLAKWQFTSKKPIKRAYERKDVNTQKWLNEKYLQIKKEAKSENADIWWAEK